MTALIRAVFQSAVFYSHELRMYALLPTLVILAWHFNDKYSSGMKLYPRQKD